MPHLPHIRVVALFQDPREPNEIRHLVRPPKRGRHIRSASGAVWIVTDVVQSGINTYTVVCVARRKHVPGMQDLMVDLLDRVRESTSPQELRRRQSTSWRRTATDANGNPSEPQSATATVPITH